MPAACKQLRGPRLALGLADAEEIGVEADVLVDGEIFVETEALRHVAERVLGALGIADDIAAGDGCLACIGRHDAGQHAQGGRLACAVRTDQAEDFAGTHVEAERIDGAHAGKALGEPVAP